MPRAPSSTKTKRGSGAKAGSNGPMRHDPLEKQIQADQMTSRFGLVSAPGRRQKQKGKRQEDGDGMVQGSNGEATTSGMRITGAIAGQDAGSKYVDPKLSRNILRLAREQQQELEEEEEEEDEAQKARPGRRGGDARMDMPDDDVPRRGRARDEAGSEDEEEDADDDDGELRSDEEGSAYEEEYEELDIDPEDAAMMERFAAEDAGEAHTGPRNLADLIMAKIEAAEQGDQEQKQAMEDATIHEKAPRRIAGSGPIPPGINPKVVEVYSKVGELLSRYKSGPLPKALKIIPTLPAWEDILYLTGPESWTPHATLAATRIFVSNLKPKQTQRFFELVLLDKVRNEIAETGKASYQIYEALKKALFKPAAFFKGILFPLCEMGCTLKEAAIVSSVLTRVSVPILHSAAALLHLAEMHYAGPTSLFIRVLLDKKYALPYKVIDALVFHFLRFADPEMGVERVVVDGVATGEKRCPVLWHQSFLVFAQRYKQDLTPDQKSALLDLLRVQYHHGISPEIRRELISAKARGEMLDEPVDDSDDDMISV